MSSSTPQDATRYWLSTRECTDLFLLYCFDENDRTTAELRVDIRTRSAAIPDLRRRIMPRRFTYPAWVAAGVVSEQVTEHPLPTGSWPEFVAALGDLLHHGLPAQRYTWRLHLFRAVAGAPGGAGPALVAVLQLSHALADGRGAATIARTLFGPPTDVPVDTALWTTVHNWTSGISRAVARAADVVGIVDFPIRMARTVIRGLAADRARRDLADLTARGLLPPVPATYPPTLLNRPPAPMAHRVRMLVRTDLRTPGHTVTVLVLTAIGAALSCYLTERGDPADTLGAQVSLALPAREPNSRNNYRDIGVDLHIGEPDPAMRADRIAASLAAARTRATHPLQDAPGRVTEVLPAAVLRRDVTGWSADVVPAALSGNTVVSSVHRGPADLALAGAPVRFTAGFPALGAVMHLTHGVHGLGETVTVSVHADPAALPDLDRYVELLETALSEVVSTLSSIPSTAHIGAVLTTGGRNDGSAAQPTN